MKQGLILIAVLLFSTLMSCREQKLPAIVQHQKIDSIVCVVDTFYYIDTIIDDECMLELDSLLTVVDSVNKVNDQLSKKLLHSNLIIENAKYYVNIAVKNPSQDKFLKGWMRRALEIK